MRVLISVVFLASTSAAAQGPAFSARAFRQAGPHVVEMEHTLTGETCRVRLRSVGEWREVYRGVGRVAVLSVRNDAALVTVAGARGATMVTTPLSADGTLGAPRTVATELGDAPYTVVATPDDVGFTALWQQLEPSRGARTFMARVDASGSLREPPHEVPVPWALAAMAYNGRGYHLALYYDGAGPGQTRLSMVSLSATGGPEQHPDWASRPGLIEEVQLVRVADRIFAVYRGGSQGDQLERRDVTLIGGWGSDPPPADSLGAIASTQEVLLVPRGERLEVVRR